MKKIDSSNITSSVLQPFTKTTWDYLQGGITEMLLALAKCVSGVPDSADCDVVLFGCIDSGGGTSWAISEGWIYDTSDQHEELFYVSQFSHALVGGQVPVLVEDFSWDSGDPIQFSDGNVHNVHAIRALKWQMGTPGSGIQDFGNLIFLSPIGYEEKWRLVGSSGQPAFQSSWVNIGGNDTPLRFKKDSKGWIHIEGCVESGGLGSPHPIFTLPAGYIPTYQKHFCINASTISNVVLDEIVIDLSGNVYQVGNGSNDNYYTKLDGISFRLD